MPRRGVIALVITAMALVLLLSFKTPEAGPVTGDTARSAARPPIVTAAPGTSRTAPPTGGSPLPAGTPTPAAGTNGQMTSPVVDTRYGPVQIEATFSRGKLTDIKAIQLPFDRELSARISQYVAPILRQEALTAQSANIDLISGATYTSEAYAQSLQAVLDQSHG